MDNTISDRYSRLKIYLDGVYQGTSNFFGANMGTGTNISFLSNVDGSAPTNGNIDEIACWGNGNVLTATQVREIFNKGLANDLNNLPTTPQPTNWWRSETATWNGFAWTLTDVNASFEMRSQNMLEANRENDVPNLYSNKSFTFDGVDDYVDCGNPAGLQITGALTISAWVKINSTSPTQVCILSKDDVTNRSYQLWGRRAVDGFPAFVIFSSNNSYIVSGTTDLRDSQWHHIVSVFTPNTSMKIYIDDVLEATNTTSIPSSIDNDPANFEIGRFGFGNYEMSGNIDEVAIFDVELSASDVTSIFNNGVPQSLESFNPISHWRMGEDATWNGTNWTLNDNGSGGNNGTSQNMVLASRTNDVPLFNTRSILFDGVDDRIDLASRTQNFTDFSLSFWVVSGGGNYKCIVGSSNASQGGILGTIVQAGGQIKYYDNTSGWTTLSGSISDGNWHHILITYDVSENTIQGYTDGSLSVTKTNVDPYGTINAHSFDRIGTRAGGQIYNEKLDEIAVWDNIINISDVWDGNNKPTNISSTNPMHWWRMGDFDSYPTLIDRGSGNNNGTMTNMTSASIVDDVPE